MFSLIQYDNDVLKTVESRFVKKKKDYSVFRNYKVKVLCTDGKW